MHAQVEETVVAHVPDRLFELALREPLEHLCEVRLNGCAVEGEGGDPSRPVLLNQLPHRPLPWLPSCEEHEGVPDEPLAVECLHMLPIQSVLLFLCQHFYGY